MINTDLLSLKQIMQKERLGLDRVESYIRKAKDESDDVQTQDRTVIVHRAEIDFDDAEC